MKQLAKLAQAIVHGPKLIILDEPTNGLDPPTRSRMISLIRQIRDGGRARILLSSHLLRDVEECCDEILVLKDGYIAANCNLEEERKANRKFIELETRGGDRAKFAEAIGGLGCEYALSGERRMKLIMNETVEISDLYRLAHRARGSDQAAEFQTRFARGNFPEGDGKRTNGAGEREERQWRFMSICTARTKASPIGVVALSRDTALRRARGFQVEAVHVVSLSFALFTRSSRRSWFTCVTMRTRSRCCR